MSDDTTAEIEPVFVGNNGEVSELEKAHTLAFAGNGGGVSTQKDDSQSSTGTPDDAIEPPMDLDKLAALSTISASRRSIIDAIARNTVGLGFTTQLAEGMEHEDSDGTLTDSSLDLRRDLEACAARDTRLDSPSFTELMMAVKTDEEEVGNGYLEVSRNKLTGKVDGLFHAPGKRMRRKRDRTGFLLMGPHGSIEPARQFYNFGEKVEYDDDGNPTSKLQDDKQWDTNEILPFRIYTSESRDYGLPRDAGMLLEYAGDKLASESNISFFDSSGTPPTVIFVQGEEQNTGGRVTFKVPQATVDRIAATLRSDGGHRHRVGIVPLPPGSKVTNVQLGQISDRDMGFVNYRQDNQARQLGAFRLSAIFISASGDTGRYTAEVERSISLEQVFDPEQTRYENRLHHTIVKDMGYPKLTLVFKRLAVENDAARRDSADKMGEVGTISRREHRKAHGFEPLPEAPKSSTTIQWPPESGDEYESEDPAPGQVPFGWNDRMVSATPPAGAQNRVVEGTGTQGLQADIGSRKRKQPVDYSKDKPIVGDKPVRAAPPH